MSILKPKTTLPWICRTINTPEKFKGQIEVFNKENKFICTGSLNEDSNINLEYIVQACNNFPKAIELLKLSAERFENAAWDANIGVLSTFSEEIEEFLKSLEENGK